MRRERLPALKQADVRKPDKIIFPPLSRFGENWPTLRFHTNFFCSNVSKTIITRYARAADSARYLTAV